MILRRTVIVPVLVLFILFTAMFVSLISIYEMPERMMGANGAYVLTSSTDNNPIRSNLDIRIAYGLENMSYITAVSPEIFVFTTIDGKAVTVRGVEFKDFMNLENGKILSGHLPNCTQEAMIGWRIARSMNLYVGENLTLYGSFKPSIAVVHITGIFKTNDPADDEILVSLPTARALAGIGAGQVSIIRVKTNDVSKVERLMNPLYPKFTVRVNSTHQIYLGDRLPVNITIRNIGKHGGWANLTLKLGNTTWKNKVYVTSQKEIWVKLKTKDVGNFNLTAVVSNDIFYYTCYTEISVIKRPASIMGSSFAYTDAPQTYTIESVNGTVVNRGNVTVMGPDSNKTYHVDGPINLTFSQPGIYKLSYSSKYFTSANMTVHAYQIQPFSALASMEPRPVNHTIYAMANTWVKIATYGYAYYSINHGPMINSTAIPVPKTANSEYHVEVRVTYGSYMSNSSFIIHAISSKPPEIFAPIKNGSSVNYLENLTFAIRDYVPIKSVQYMVNGKLHIVNVNQNFSREVVNYTYNFTVQVNSAKFSISISTLDLWNRTINFAAKCPVLIDKDIEKPEIIVPENTILWGGNRTEVRARDNVGIANVSVFVFGKYFNSTTGDVWIPTSFSAGGVIYYVPPGAYLANVMAEDTSGNKNYTNFTIIINNTGERNPPVIVGPGFANLSSGEIEFDAYDNVGVQSMYIYNGSTLLKEGFGDNITLSSNDLTNGSYHLKIIAKDYNGNLGYKYVTIVKNYTDTIKPVIVLTKNKIWSGNTTWIIAMDNIMMKKLTVNVFGMTFTGTSRVAIHTEFGVNHTLQFIHAGGYIVHVVAEDIYGNVNETYFTLVINNTGETLPPKFILPVFEEYDATDNISFRSFDNVGVERMWIMYQGDRIAESNGSWLNFSASLLPCAYDHVSIFAEDKNGNLAWKNITISVKDNIPPKLITNFVSVWSGQNITIRGWDNVRVLSMSISIFGKNYTTHNNTLAIPTMYIHANAVSFIAPGNYSADVKMEDSYRNREVYLIHILINNVGEKLPPVIIGPPTGAINMTTSIEYRAYDNVGVKKMWALWNGKKIFSSSNGTLSIKYGKLPAGINIISVFAEDVNGNTAMIDVNVIVESVKHVDMNATLEKSNITVNDRTNIIVNLKNQDANIDYNITVSVDNSPYYSSTIHLSPYEHRVIYIVLPYLDHGTHKIDVNGQILTLRVVQNPVSKLPTDLVLKYSNDLKFTESKNVIYKGFQISEGNFLLVLSALIAVTLILIFLGLYSTAMKGLKNENIGILRAIGASNRQIFKFFMKESWLYFLVPGILGIVGGYLLVIIINNMDMLTAFGHHLTIVPTWRDIGLVAGVTFTFIFTSLFVIYWHMMHIHVTRIMGHGNAGKVVNLDDMLRENS